jgi:cyclophilin family peptidyl-prolyl cis-trans isomerase
LEDSLPKYNPENQKVYFDIQHGQKEPQKIVFELFNDTVPKTTENFRQLCTSEKGISYNKNIFHRVIKDFMMQGGDFEKANGTGGYSIYGDKFNDEGVWFPHTQGYLLSMANAGPNTNGSQFFITFKETPWLNGKHTVFGRVIKGRSIVDYYNGVECGEQNLPNEAVTIVGCGEYKEEIPEGELEL